MSHRHYGNDTEAHVIREVSLDHGTPRYVQDSITSSNNNNASLSGEPGVPIFTEIFKLPIRGLEVREPLAANASACSQVTTSYSNTTSGSVAMTSVATPYPSCSMQKQDPDEGITQAYCVCQASVTLPLLTKSKVTRETQSCESTAIPSNTAWITPITTLGPATTYSALCEVCSLAVINENSCSTISGCTPSAGVAKMTAASSHVHVGTLTGSNLYTAVSNALETACPSITQATAMSACTTDAVVVGDKIEYVQGNRLEKDGELSIKVAWSQYNESSVRDAMIKGIAQGIMLSASGNNCYNATYEEEHFIRRDLVHSHHFAHADNGVQPRGDTQPFMQRKHVDFCNSAWGIQFQYWNPYWRQAPSPGATDYIAAELEFTVGADGHFICEMWEGLAEALTVIQPEFALEEIGLDEAIEFLCEDSLADPS